MATVNAAALRNHLQDYTSTNIPLGIQYLTDPDLETCIDRAVEDFNETPPIMFNQPTKADFPYPHLLLVGASVEALKLTAIKELRGEMNYNDGGISSAVYYKSPQFNQLKNELQQEYTEKKMRIKRQINLSNGFGGVG